MYFFLFQAQIVFPGPARLPAAGTLDRVSAAILIVAVSAAAIIGILVLARGFAIRRRRSALGFDKSVLLITLPKESLKAEEQSKVASIDRIREGIAVAESLFSAFGGLRAERGFGPWFFGRSDEFSMEIVTTGGLISFYVSVPNHLREFAEQQIHAQYPHAQIEDVQDYNIFSPRGVILGRYLSFKRPGGFPIKTYKKLDSDSMGAITNSMSKIAPPDGAAVQFVARSAKGTWRKAGLRVASSVQQGKSLKQAIDETSFFGNLLKAIKPAPKKDSNAPKKEYRLSPLEEDAVRGLEEKASKAGMEVNIRIIVSSEDKSRAMLHLDNITNAFSQFNIYEYGNSFARKTPRSLNRFIKDFIYRAFDESNAVLLNSEEFASVFHFPLPTTETPNIRWLGARKSSPPSELPSDGLILGYSEYRGIKKEVRIRDADRVRHMYVIGRSGTGKSTLMKQMAIQDAREGRGFCIIDPHGDLVEDILANIPKERADDVVLFEPGDTERPVGLNMLECDNEDQRDFTVQEMISIFYKLFPPEMIGPMFEHNMRNVMLTLMADLKSPGTIAEIPRMFSDPEFQKHWVAKVKDPVVRAFWEKEMAKTSDFHKSEMLGYLVSKVGRFVENEMMRNIIGQVKSGFNIREIMDQGKILLVNLSKGKTGDVNANLLGLIIVTKLQVAALSRADLPEAERKPFYLYIDEFQNFITPSIATILSEARKYQLGLIVAHQYMGQLEQPKGNTEIRDAVLGNAGTILCFRIGVEDAELMAKEFAPVFNSYDLINIENQNAYIKLLINQTASKPFAMHTIFPPRGDQKLANALRQISRLKYGRDKRLVGAEILERSKLGASGAKSGPMLGEKSM